MDSHRPKDGDINENGDVNKTRLKEEAAALFQHAMKAFFFVNFYQLKQFVLRFAGYWGFQENNVVVDVTCIGEMGAVIKPLAEGASDYGHRMVKYTAARKWISKKGESGSGKGSRLIVSHVFNSTQV